MPRPSARCAKVLAQQRERGDWVRVASLLNNLAALYEARGEWQAARACLDEGIEISDRARHRPGAAAPAGRTWRSSATSAATTREAERVSRRALEVARAMANRGAEATALINLVRLALRRGDSAAARDRSAAGDRRSAHALEIQLDCLLAFARLRALEGAATAAAPLLRYFLARPEIEPADRDDAEACLAGLPSGAADAAPLAARPRCAGAAHRRGDRARSGSGLRLSRRCAAAERRGTPAA